MEIIDLNYNSFSPLTASYSLDSEVTLKKDVLYTENNLFFALESILKTPNDFSSNNYSNLYLSKRDNINNNLQIQALEPLNDEGFSTYLAANATTIFSPNSRFWVVEEPVASVNAALVAASGTQSNIDNRYFFEITFLDNYSCKISHENSGIVRYLTIDYTGNLIFAKDSNTDYLGDNSPQIFNYVYDRQNDLILIIKNVNDIIFYVSFSPNNDELILVQSLTGTSFSYTSNSIFKCVSRSETANVTPINDPWSSYKKDSLKNSLAINTALSYENSDSNILTNTQYLNATAGKIDVNLLSLKNTNTPENYQSRNNPFFNENRTLMRDFKKLFTGSNQLLGNDNITLGYEAYTSNIILKKDKVTYFHVPQNFYPFKQLNINDAGLAEAGAIAGDHPLKSDKIFKKKADYSNTSYFGNSKEENSGDFLCAWLSGNSDVNSKPVWVDRYYNPSKISFFQALTASNINAIEYTSVFACLNTQVPEGITVFDKPSDVIFEPGTYFAYHHIGETFCTQYLSSLSINLIQKNFDTYLKSNGAPASNSLTLNEFIFDGQTYCITDNLSSIQVSNQFTIIFDMYNADWSKPFAYQVLGNYCNDGFGIFNYNSLTPALFLNSLSSIRTTNLDFKLLDTLELPISANALLTFEGFDNYFVITSDGYFRKYNNKNGLVYKIYNDNFKKIYSYDYDNTNCYVLGKDPTSNTALLFKIVLDSGEVTQLNTSFTQYSFYFFSVPSSSIVNARTVNYYNNAFYFTAGDKTERIQDKIYIKTGNGIYRWDIPSSTTYILAFSALNSLQDFNIDLDGNVWILFGNYNFSKYDSSRSFVLSGTLPLTGATSKNINFSYELEGNTVKEHVYVTSLSTNNSAIVSKLDTNGVLIDTVSYKNNGPINVDLTQNRYLRTYISENYPDSSLNLKFKLVNAYNALDTQNVNLIYNLTALDPGYHNFAVRFDSYSGIIHFIVDGQIASTASFAPRKYSFSDLIYRPFFFGTSNYSNNISMSQYLYNNSFNARGITVKNFYLYNDALNYFDIIFHTRASELIEDVVFDLACGRRNYLDEIERYFKFRIPGNKSALMNIVLRNSGISNLELQNEIEKRIYALLAKTAPAYIKINNIEWSN
jgi:hypothetical protein